MCMYVWVEVRMSLCSLLSPRGPSAPFYVCGVEGGLPRIGPLSGECTPGTPHNDIRGRTLSRQRSAKSILIFHVTETLLAASDAFRRDGHGREGIRRGSWSPFGSVCRQSPALGLPGVVESSPVFMGLETLQP